MKHLMQIMILAAEFNHKALTFPPVNPVLTDYYNMINNSVYILNKTTQNI